jgi:hydrogenase maturation protein HypF
VSNLSTKHKQQGVEILVRGTVQGVGFRPFIYNLASRFEICGTVTNTGDGVVITATAPNDRLNLFQQAIRETAPPLSRITSIESSPLTAVIPTETFSILPSSGNSSANTAIPPDITLCKDCLDELLDPADRRFHYPFINCTNCGPRFTIVESIPYDRPATSMKDFSMCKPCLNEYHDPTNRRFHAQPNGCPDCGPQISLHDKEGNALIADSPLKETVTHLAKGAVVAIRGLGGFHLVVDGCSETAVSLLRERKNRPHKPLAIMVRDITQAKRFCHINGDEESMLSSLEHPIVLLRKKENSNLAVNLAPAIDEIGIMLPYTPLHHLLFQVNNCPEALVMTSGNISGAPICTAREDALIRLADIADFFLLHNREILTRVDDSVVKVMDEFPLILRRARGYVPAPVPVKWKLPHIIGCGGGLKSTFCLGRDHSTFLSQHIGDLDSLESYDFYLESIDHFKRVFQLEPEAVACDLHPDYMSSRYGSERDLPLYKIQHHHAHAAAVIAEHGLDSPVLAVIFDGTGLGTDGTSWGGEILKADLTSFTRLGHLSYLPLPGGDIGATEPWRMGLAALFHTFGEDGLDLTKLPYALKQIDPARISVISSMLTNGFNAPPTTSCGRLFDSIASILGIRQTMSFEGQAAMELEACARRAHYPLWQDDISPKSHMINSHFLKENDGKWEICSAEFVKMAVDDLRRGEPAHQVALRFHSLLISSITKLIENLSHQTGIRQVVLSGGCMQNSLLLNGLFHTLQRINLKVFTGNSIPVNDGGISFGQTIIGGLRHVSRNSDESNQCTG